MSPVIVLFPATLIIVPFGISNMSPFIVLGAFTTNLVIMGKLLNSPVILPVPFKSKPSNGRLVIEERSPDTLLVLLSLNDIKLGNVFKKFKSNTKFIPLVPLLPKFVILFNNPGTVTVIWPVYETV